MREKTAPPLDQAPAQPGNRHQLQAVERMLAALLLLALAALPISLGGSGPEPLRWLAGGVNLLVVGCAAASIAQARRGRLARSVAITTASLVAALLIDLATTGILSGAGIVLGLALPIVLSGVVPGRRLRLALTAACSAGVAAITLADAFPAALPLARPAVRYALPLQAAGIITVAVGLTLIVDAISGAFHRTVEDLAAAEAAARGRERYLQSIFDGIATPMFIIEIDEAGGYRFGGANIAYEQIMGLDRSGLAGQPIERVFPADRLAQIRATYDRCAREGVADIEEQHVPWGGASAWWLRVLTPLRDETGRVTRLVGTGIDISQRRAAEAALRESQERYRLIAEHTSDLICLLDSQGRYVYASPSYRSGLGYDPAGLIGAVASDLIHPEDLAELARDLRWMQVGGSTRLTYRFRHSDGAWRLLESHLTTVAEQGQVYFIVISRDVTLQRQLETQVSQSHKMEAIGRLAGSLAHDFNNLLAVISGGAELARESLPEGHPAQVELRDVLVTAERARALTRQLLTLARGQPYAPQRVDVNELLLSLERLLARLLPDGVALRFALAPEGQPAVADPSQIGQLMMNLVANARDAMPAGGTITVETRPATLPGEAPLGGVARLEPFVMVAVRDGGVGMDGETLRRVFEPFFTTKPAGVGTGLGMAICHGIVRQHGGQIAIESELGRGTTVRVYLPLAAGDATTPEQRAA